MQQNELLLIRLKIHHLFEYDTTPFNSFIDYNLCLKLKRLSIFIISFSSVFTLRHGPF